MDELALASARISLCANAQIAGAWGAADGGIFAG
jgi:hypothetical protein